MSCAILFGMSSCHSFGFFRLYLLLSSLYQWLSSQHIFFHYLVCFDKVKKVKGLHVKVRKSLLIVWVIRGRSGLRCTFFFSGQKLSNS